MSTMISVIFHIGSSINTDKDMHWSASAILYSTVTETATFSHHQGQTRVVILFPSLHYLTLLVVTCSSPLLSSRPRGMYQPMHKRSLTAKLAVLFLFPPTLNLVNTSLYIYSISSFGQGQIFLFSVSFSSPKEVMVFSSYNCLIIWTLILRYRKAWIPDIHPRFCSGIMCQNGFLFSKLYQLTSSKSTWRHTVKYYFK